MKRKIPQLEQRNPKLIIISNNSSQKLNIPLWKPPFPRFQFQISITLVSIFFHTLYASDRNTVLFFFFLSFFFFYSSIYLRTTFIHRVSIFIHRGERGVRELSFDYVGRFARFRTKWIEYSMVKMTRRGTENSLSLSLSHIVFCRGEKKITRRGREK